MIQADSENRHEKTSPEKTEKADSRGPSPRRSARSSTHPPRGAAAQSWLAKKLPRQLELLRHPQKSRKTTTAAAAKWQTIELESTGGERKAVFQGEFGN
ncbi:hypothetical protein Y1Q_0016656 [Alligator mississippiensis]|uniref:Uncharacterized protein n=1 Tax=Alligator mississippiensis TaxID=8496 RepID=A0A151P1W3_ALLMI|nr:hypothetical protein Y1Q_0016656 [Alligator mississippiensis]